MNSIEHFKQHFEQLQSGNGLNGLGTLQRAAFNDFSKMGIPNAKHEEWKYTRIGSLFNKDYEFPVKPANLSEEDLNTVRLPGYKESNELFFINGIFSHSLSTIRSDRIGRIAFGRSGQK